MGRELNSKISKDNQNLGNFEIAADMTSMK